jgi:hypothetical protein
VRDPQTITWEGKPLLSYDRDTLVQIVCQVMQDLESERKWNKTCGEMREVFEGWPRRFTPPMPTGG